MIERRRYKRYLSNLKATLYPSGNQEVKLRVETRDVSKQGMRVCLSSELLLGSDVIIKCELPNVTEEVTLFGDIVWVRKSLLKKGFYETGIKFTSIGQEDKMHWYEYLLSFDKDKLFSEKPSIKKSPAQPTDTTSVSRVPESKMTMLIFLLKILAIGAVAFIIIVLLYKYVIDHIGIWGIHY